MDERRIEFPTIEDNYRLFREAEQILSPEEYPFRGKALHSPPLPQLADPTARQQGGLAPESKNDYFAVAW